MKKALIVLLILGVTGGLFAQDITWTGSVGTGVFFNFGDSHDPANVTADDDDDGTPVIAKLGAKYDAGDWGIKLGIVGRAGDGFNLTWNNAYGWLNFMGGMINLKAGYIKDGVWSNAGPWIDDNGLSQGGGLRLEVTPIDGLNLGALFTFPSPASFYAGEIPFWFQQTAFGFSFDGGVFNIAATMRLYSEEDVYTAAETDAALAANFGFSGIEIVTIDIGAWIDNLIGDPDMGITLTETFGFHLMDALTLDLHLIEFLCDGLQEFRIAPRISYKVLPAFTVGLNLDFAMLNNPADDFGFGEIKARLWGKYTVGSDAWIKGGYGFKMLTKDYGDSLDHYIMVTFGFSF